VVEKTVPLETHLSTVTALEAERARNSRLERLNSGLQSELFQYLRLMDETNKELIEAKTRMRSTHERLLELEKERIQVRRQPKPFWKRLLGL